MKRNQKAIYCDNCKLWIHLPCSDLSDDKYREFQQLDDFEWTCNVCRNNDYNINRTDSRLKTFDNLPSSNLHNSKGKLLLQYNCRSISDKIDDLKSVVYDLEPLIVILTETWLDKSHPKNFLHIEGYKNIRKDRTDEFKQKYQKKGGGGVALIYRSDLRVKSKKT